MSIVSLITQKRKGKTKNRERRATEILHRLIYGGAGPKFLGWGYADALLLPDGTWQQIGKDGWRFWTVPTEQDHREWWNPIWEHLKGNHRGVVAIKCKDVPFLSVDLDRHDSTISTRDHIIRVLRVGRLLKKHFPELSWSVAEVNDRNGSAKLFGFAGKPIPIAKASDLGKRVHDFLVENGLGGLEVFPFNCVQVGLPMRADKTTIVSAGVLDKCSRKKKVAGRFVQFEAYSVAAFLDAIRSRSPYDEDTLHRVLKKACANLPDCLGESRKFQATTIQHDPGQSAAVQTPRATGDYEGEPNALTRQLRALLELARRLRRVPNEGEALSYLKENRLYSGDWSENEGRRSSRVRWIISHVAKTFDPAKCNSATYQVEFSKFDNWARTHVGKLREKVRYYVDEYGRVHEKRRRSVVEWSFVSVMLSILDFCFAHPNPDQSLPQEGSRTIWETSLRAGLIETPWDDHKWAIVRDWLEDLGVIEVFDRNWHFNHGRGQAMKWRPTEKFRNLHHWYRAKHQPTANNAVSLEEFLGNKQNPPPLNYYLDSDTLIAGFEPEDGRWKPPP